MSKLFDICVIGGGPGGYVAAIRAAQLGLTVALVERDKLGGICLNWGCIPMKALLRTAEIRQILLHADGFGLAKGSEDFDTAKVFARSRQVSDKLAAGVEFLLRKNNVQVFRGDGQLIAAATPPHEVSVKTSDGQQLLIRAKNVILSTGARAAELPHLRADGESIWTYRHALTPNKIPASLLIIGAGAIGMELASFYNDMGTKVTVVEAQERILPSEDEEVAELVRHSLEIRGIEVITSATVTSVNRKYGDVCAEIWHSEESSERVIDRVILSVGIVANTEDLGLDDTQVRIVRGHVVTNAQFETDHRGVFAIGDLTGPPWLAHKASHEATLCAEHIAGNVEDGALAPPYIPSCTYTRPQVASIGIIEREAKAQGLEVRVGRFPLIGNGKAIALGESDGLVKTIFCKRTGALLGAAMVGPDVTELIHGFALAMTLEATEAEIMRTVFPHPTLSEAMHESTLDAFGRAIHFSA